MKKDLFSLVIILILMSGAMASSFPAHQFSKIDDTKIVRIEPQPCDLIQESELKVLFNLPADAQATIENTVRTHPTCFYKWKTLHFTETKKIGSSEIKMEVESEITLVLVQNATDQMFDASTRAYRDGQNVEAIGEKAIWGDTLSQITFLSHGYLIHLHVKMSSSAAENKEKAIALAKLITEKL